MLSQVVRLLYLFWLQMKNTFLWSFISLRSLSCVVYFVSQKRSRQQQSAIWNVSIWKTPLWIGILRMLCTHLHLLLSSHTRMSWHHLQVDCIVSCYENDKSPNITRDIHDPHTKYDAFRRSWSWISCGTKPWFWIRCLAFPSGPVGDLARSTS
jgi:hypothetical protein